MGWSRYSDSEYGARLSPCGTYRYELWRRWSQDGDSNQVVFIGLNPSTADEIRDDPTIRRCIRFAKTWGYSGLLVLNAFAYRATRPRDLKMATDPIGEDNNETLKIHCRDASLIIAAWGVHCPKEREEEICHTIGKTIHCLGKTKAGRPRHPLYVKAEKKPEVFWDHH